MKTGLKEEEAIFSDFQLDYANFQDKQFIPAMALESLTCFGYNMPWRM